MIPPYSHTLKQPLQFKIGTIKNICKTINKIITVVLILFVLFLCCFVIAPMPIRYAVHKVYYHPSFVTNQSSMQHLGKSIKPYIIPQKILPDFPGPTNLSSNKISDGFGGRIDHLRKQINFRNADTLLESFKKTNEGTLRIESEVVLLLFKKPERMEMENLFYRLGGSCQDSPHFNSLFDKIEKYESITKAIEYLTRPERNILSKLMPYSCYRGEIPYKIKQLAYQILELVRKIKINQINPVVAASYVHQEIMRIQPFETGSDTTARLWMNILLQMGGYKAIAVAQDDYRYLLDTDIRIPGYFSRELENIIVWNRNELK